MNRIVLPKELTQLLDLHSKSPVAIKLRGNEIILTKAEPECAFCGAVNGEKGELIPMGHRFVCPDCAKESCRKTQENPRLD